MCLSQAARLDLVALSYLEVSYYYFLCWSSPPEIKEIFVYDVSERKEQVFVHETVRKQAKCRMG